MNEPLQKTQKEPLKEAKTCPICKGSMRISRAYKVSHESSFEVFTCLKCKNDVAFFKPKGR